MSRRNLADLQGDAHESLEITVLRLLEGYNEGLTLDHLHSQLRQMDHPECPSKSQCSKKRGPQAVLKDLLIAMPRLGYYSYEGDTAFFLKDEDSQHTSRVVEHAGEKVKTKSRHVQQSYIRRPFPRGSIIGSLDLKYPTEQQEVQAVRDLKEKVIKPTIDDLVLVSTRMKFLSSPTPPWRKSNCFGSEMSELMKVVLDIIARLEEVQ